MWYSHVAGARFPGEAGEVGFGDEVGVISLGVLGFTLAGPLLGAQQAEWSFRHIVGVVDFQFVEGSKVIFDLPDDNANTFSRYFATDASQKDMVDGF